MDAVDEMGAKAKAVAVEPTREVVEGAGFFIVVVVVVGGADEVVVRWKWFVKDAEEVMAATGVVTSTSPSPLLLPAPVKREWNEDRSMLSSSSSSSSACVIHPDPKSKSASAEMVEGNPDMKWRLLSPLWISLVRTASMSIRSVMASTDEIEAPVAQTSSARKAHKIDS